MASIVELLPAYKDYLEHEKRLARSTVWAYTSDLRALARALDKDVELITRKDLRAYMRQLSRAGRAASTIRRTMHGFGTFWKWLYVEGRVKEVVTEYIDLPRKNVTVPTWMTEDELRQFVLAAERPGVSLRESVAWLLLAYTGMRPDELRRLRIADVNTSDGVVVIRNTKSRRDRVLPLPRHLTPALSEMMRGRRETDYLLGFYAAPWRRQRMIEAFNRNLERAELSSRGYTMYTIRHSFATHLALAGVPAHLIKDLMGHRSIATTEIYLHAAPAHLHNAMQSYVLNREP